MEKNSYKKKILTFSLVLALTASYAAAPVFGVDVFAAEADSNAAEEEGVLSAEAASVNLFNTSAVSSISTDDEGVLSASAASVNLLNAANTADSKKVQGMVIIVVPETETADLHAEANANSAKVASLKRGGTYAYTDYKDSWYYLSDTAADKTAGWIADNYVEAYELNADGTYTKKKKTEKGTLTVANTPVNVRSGAGLDYSVLTIVSQGETYNYYDEKNGWYYIQLNGSNGNVYGWILGDYVKATPKNVTTTAATTTTTTAVTTTTTTVSAATTTTSSNTAAELKINKVSVERGVSQGKTTTIRIEAQGDGLTYSWRYQDDTNGKIEIADNNTNTYSEKVTKYNNGRRVWCVVTDKYGHSKSTEDIYLSYIDVTEWPADARVKKGETATFKVKAEGAGLSYRWQLQNVGSNEWRNSSVTADTYSVTVNEDNNGRRVRCLITDKYGNSVTTNSAEMRISANKFVMEDDVLTKYEGNEKNVVIPNTVKVIGEGAFDCNDFIESVTIPDTVTKIGNRAFNNCDSLKSVTIPNSVTVIGSEAFSKCGKLTSLTLPNSVTTIGKNAIAWSGVTSLTVPASVTSISNGAFTYANSLKSITVDSSNTKYADQNGVLFNKDLTQVICYPAGRTDTGYALPSSVTSIADYAFQGVDLTTLTIPKSVTSIGEDALWASSIKTVNYGGSEEAWKKVSIKDENSNISWFKLRTSTVNYTKTAAKIITQPTDSSIKNGGTASFTVKAEGDGLTYQWQLSDDGKTWRDSKVTTADYATTLSAAKNSRYVRCVVTDKYGNSVTSKTAQMKIAGPELTTQLVNAAARKDENVSFKIGATGDGITYKWQLSEDGKTWRDSKVTTATYTATMSKKNDGRLVRCVVTDKYGNSVTSNAAKMNLSTLTIQTQPSSVTVKSGASVSFNIKAKGDDIVYQWQVSNDKGKTWSDSKLTGTTYTTTLDSSKNGRYVRCVVTDKYGYSLASNAAYMKITSLKITGQPVSATVKSGELVTFEVTAEGPGLTYQWQYSDNKGKTWRNSRNKTNSYSSNLYYYNNGRYMRCIVKDKYGNSVTSNTVYMKQTSLKITSQPSNITAKSGENVTFKVTANGPGVTYQWQLSDDKGKTWRNSSVRTATYTAALNSSSNGRYVRCVVTDKYGNQVISKSARMKMR